MPEIAFFACQQHNPEAFWKPEYQQHENGATAISDVTLVADRPGEHAAFFSRLLGGARIEEETDALSIHTGRGVIHVQSPGASRLTTPADGPGTTHRAPC